MEQEELQQLRELVARLRANKEQLTPERDELQADSNRSDPVVNAADASATVTGEANCYTRRV